MFEGRKVVCFGIGRNFFPYMKRLEQDVKVDCFCDNNSSRWGSSPFLDERACIAPSRLGEMDAPVVIIMVDVQKFILEIEKQLDEEGLEHYRILDVLNRISCRADSSWLKENAQRHIHKFLDLNLHGITACNFHCSYCYVWRRFGFENGIVLSEHSPGEIRSRLSREKTGGTCFINLCARGETLLCPEVAELVYELLEEGHYVSVVTNGTVTKSIQRILSFPKALQRRMFFKLSFHYLELKKRSLFDLFWNNVNAIRDSACSYTLEITPSDDLVPYVDEIRNMFERKADGALPHVSFARDSTRIDYDILSDYTVEEYNRIWGQFDSEMFRLKSDYYNQKIEEYCYAGQWSYLVNLLTGDIKSCYRQDVIGNLYSPSFEGFPDAPVGHDCHMAYCFNNHAFLAWGTVPEIRCQNYLAMRDRVDRNGKHWVKEPVRSFMKDKLYDTHCYEGDGQYGYEKLVRKNRKPAIVLLNSPDYENAGDHAIALAEKKLLTECFPDYEWAEITCGEFQKKSEAIFRIISRQDIIVITGGGNIGSLWLRIEDYTTHIIEELQENKILIFPQSIYFAPSPYGERERAYFCNVVKKHGRVTVMARDRHSYHWAGEWLGPQVRTLYAPDMAMYLEPVSASVSRQGALLCMRQDHESLGWDREKIKKIVKTAGLEVEEISALSEKRIHIRERQEAVTQVLEMLAGKKLVVTDRLHCMIFCALSGTPCIALDNITGKLSGVYEWIRDISHIRLVRAEEEMQAAFDALFLEKACSNAAVFERLQNDFRALADFIRKEVLQK